MADHPVDLSGLMSRAHRFAERNHVDERRRDYLHKVRLILAGAHVTAPSILLAPVMLEVLQTRSISPFEVEEEFGPKVLKLVTELIIDPDLDESTRRAAQLERAPTLSHGAKVVLLATLIATLGTLRTDRTLKENKDYVDWAEMLAEAISGVNSDLDALCDEMVEHARNLIDDARGCWAPLSHESGQKSRKATQNQPDTTFLRVDAERGVSSVDIRWNKAIAHVTIDGRQIRLSNVLGHALDIAACFSELGKDGIPLFIDPKTFGLELGSRTGGTYKKLHNIRMPLYRLRKKLSENGVNPWLVEMPPRGGVRFRCRRIAANSASVPELEELVTTS